jgi:RimJ/RimL family protein N-acetyltransferase
VLETLRWNEMAIRAYENAGLHRAGNRRQAAVSLGAPTDVLLMDAVRADFIGSILAC